MIVQAAASHTASLTEWQNSSETVLASVAADGAISALVELDNCRNRDCVTA